MPPFKQELASTPKDITENSQDPVSNKPSKVANVLRNIIGGAVLVGAATAPISSKAQAYDVSSAETKESASWKAEVNRRNKE